MDRVRLAAPERLQGATDHSIGVKIRHVENTRLVNAFGPWFDFYEVERSGPYWTEITINRAVALANQGRFTGVKMVLYWRRAPGSHRA